MTGLTLPSAQPRPRWETVDLGGGETFEVQITPPNYNHYIRGKYQERVDDLVNVRLLCVTDWRGVFLENPGGLGRMELPFSRETLGHAMSAYPALCQRLVELVTPFWAGPSEEQAGNSPAPSGASSAAATTETTETTEATQPPTAE